MPVNPTNRSADGLTIQQEMAIRTRTFSYRVANLGIVGLNAAYVGGDYVTQYFDILRPIMGRFMSNPSTVITPNMICMRFSNLNVVIITGVSTAGQGLELAAGGALVKPLYDIPGNVFGALWSISDACISYIQSCFKSITSRSKWLIFGHSMGGGLSYMVAARLLKQFSVPYQNITGVYTFGNPKPGDPEFSFWMSRQVPCFSIHAAGDPIPSNPPIGSQYLWNVGNALTSPFSNTQVSLTFDYKHVAEVWKLNPDGTLETTDGISSAIQLTREQLQGILGQVSGIFDSSLNRHSPYNYQNSLNAANGDWRNSIALINLGGLIQEQVPDAIEAPAAPPYPNNVANPAQNPANPAVPVIPPFDPQQFHRAFNLPGTPAKSRITGNIIIVPRVNDIVYNPITLRAIDTTVSEQNYCHGYDRRLLLTIQSAIKNMRKEDGKKMMRGNSTNVIIPNDENAEALAIVNNHIEELLSLHS